MSDALHEQDALLFLPSLRGGGAERVMMSLAGAFTERGLSVAIALGQATGPYLEQLHPGVEIVDLAAPRMARVVRPLAERLRSHPPRALLSALPHANVAAMLAHRRARSRARTVLVEQLDVGKLRRAPSGWIERLLPTLMRFAYRRADGVVAVSDGVARSLESEIGLPLARTRTIPNPVDVERVRALAAEADPEAEAMRSGDAPVLVAMGRLAPQKDFPTLLQAFALLRRQRPVRLRILGEGELRADLEALVRGLDLGASVSLDGFRANPYPSLAAARLYVSSSAWEGMPNALLEALALGVPVVSTDCESGPAEALDGGRHGELVPVGDVRALAEAMARALDALPDREALRARAERFSLTRVVPAYLEALGLAAAREDGA